MARIALIGGRKRTRALRTEAGASTPSKGAAALGQDDTRHLWATSHDLPRSPTPTPKQRCSKTCRGWFPRYCEESPRSDELPYSDKSDARLGRAMSEGPDFERVAAGG